jgi:hypothetical protein
MAAIPNNYWWEVIDKNGSQSFYGGDPTSGLVADAVLTDYNGNIFKWALRETRDTNGNNVQYRYMRVNDVGLAQGSVPGYELYIKTIHYTGYQNQAGRYQVTFIRDRELGESQRPDVTISARGGFKQVTADLLRKVEIHFDNQPVRSYVFNYREGAFHKTLLESITQLGDDGSPFNTHTFEYYDDARDANGDYKGFAPPQKWEVGDDQLASRLKIQGNPSALGGNLSKEIGAHFYTGVGFSGPTNKGSSVGAKIGYNRSNSKGIVSLIDINGDGLSDKVFKDGDTVYYRANQSGPQGGVKFASPRKIASLTDLSKEESHLFSMGPEFYIGVKGGMNFALGYTRQAIYFTDVNGDGLPDLVKNKKVLFNHLDSEGHPVFTTDSADTPSPVGEGADVDTSGASEEDEASYQEQLDNFPLLDTVRRWIAPYEGSISINGTVALLEDTSSERQDYETADGVRVVIQHNDTELWRHVLRLPIILSKRPPV